MMPVAMETDFPTNIANAPIWIKFRYQGENDMLSLKFGISRRSESVRYHGNGFFGGNDMLNLNFVISRPFESRCCHGD